MGEARVKCRHCGAPIDRSHRFCSSCGTSAVASSDAALPINTAERRQITVVFVDIVASTALAEQLGDETFRELVCQYRVHVASTFQKYGGVLAHYFGDGVLVYFGYPNAQEADARRAVQASLELQSTITELSGTWEDALGVRVQLRTAVHTGRVVAGDISAGSTTERLAVIGNVPNIAARLQEAAEPGSVTIGQATFDLVHGAFACTFLGTRTLRGVSEEMALFRIDGPARSTTSFGARANQARMVGRDSELGLLAEAWENVRQGSSGIVLIEAEAGMGKSRLITELIACIDQRVCRQVLLQCSPIFRDSALHPVREYIRAAFELDDRLASNEWIKRLQAGLEATKLDQGEYIALLAPLLGLHLPPERQRGSTGSPQQERELLHRRLIEWLLNEASDRPVLFVVEDLHWADPSTLELLSRAAKELSSAQILMVLSTRPSFPISWLDATPATTLHLERLEESDAKLLIDLIARDRQLSPTAMKSLQARTDGVPLFIEEVTLAALAIDADACARSVNDPGLIVPSTLQESLTARIDHVAVDRELLHLCATLGREFDGDLLALSWTGGRELLRSELDKLIAADLLLVRQRSGTTRYVFRHALIQEAIYGLQLGAQRRQNHSRVAEMLTRHFPKLLESTPEIIAAHYLHAGDEKTALPLLQHAAQIALRRSAILEASNHLRRALQIVQRLPDRAGRTQQELELLCSLGVTLSAREGFASEEAGRVFGEALAICRGAGRIVGLFPAMHGLYRYNSVRGNLSVASDISAEMLSIGRRQRDKALQVEAQRAAGMCRFLKGSPAKASCHFKQVILHYERDAHRDHRVLYGTDPYVIAVSMEALIAQLAGERDHAREQITRAIRDAEEIEHPYSLCWALALASVVYHLGGEAERLQDNALRQSEIARQHEFGLWQANSAIFLGWFAAVYAADESAIAVMQDGIARWRQSGSYVYLPYFMSLLAEGHWRWGAADECESVLADALAIATANEEMWWVPRLQQMRRDLGPNNASPKATAGRPSFSSVGFL